MNNAEIIADVVRTRNAESAASEIVADIVADIESMRAELDAANSADPVDDTSRAAIVARLKAASVRHGDARQALDLARVAHAFARERLSVTVAGLARQGYSLHAGNYVGKSAGEKTRAKFAVSIAEDVAGLLGVDRTAAGVRCWFVQDFCAGSLHVATGASLGYLNVTLYASYECEHNGRIIDTSNRFTGCHMDVTEEIDPRTPEQFAADFIAAEQAASAIAEKARAELDQLRAGARFGWVSPASYRLDSQARTFDG